MGFGFHSDKKRYFEIQTQNATDFVIPFITKSFPLAAGMRVMEIGCAEGGVLKAFLDFGMVGTGVELSPPRAQKAKDNLVDYVKAGNAEIISKDIFLVDADSLGGKFDLIILKDVIEHIHDQKRFMMEVGKFLKPEGCIFFGFPPWVMPFGGHQQTCSNNLLKKLPYYHILPMPLYKGILKLGGETQLRIDKLAEIKDTRISIERFEKISKENDFKIIETEHFLINPIYKYKFGLEGKIQYSWITKIPYLRNFVTTCVYYLLQK